LAAVHSRKINDKTLTLSASGWTFNFTFVLYDYETESLWYPLRRGFGPTCVSGDFEDLTLVGIDSKVTFWSTWEKEHPNTKYMKNR
jgi:hypothetical protein